MVKQKIKPESYEMPLKDPYEHIAELKAENKLLKSILGQLLKIDLNQCLSFF